MLQDMVHLVETASTISFALGSPLRPFQQLLGCLPPASVALVPKPYAWLMTNPQSPVLHFYPLTFEIDADGKKASWEAIVKLPFINENLLFESEAQYCPISSLTLNERKRNEFGHLLLHFYNPNIVDTYFSCNPEIGLPDVTRCCTQVILQEFSIAPGYSFVPRLVDGTQCPIAGYPALGVFDFLSAESDFMQINVFGSASKYRSLMLKMAVGDIDPEAVGNLQNLRELLGASVYVNYPLIHEARVVALSTATEEYRLVTSADSMNEEIVKTVHDVIKANKWAKDSAEEVFFIFYCLYLPMIS